METTAYKAICHLHRGQKEVKFKPSQERRNREVPGSALREKEKVQHSPKNKQTARKNVERRIKILLIC